MPPALGSHQPLPWQGWRQDTERGHQDLYHVTLAGFRLCIPRFSHILTSVHSLSHPSFSCVGIQRSFWNICISGYVPTEGQFLLKGEMPVGIHGGAEGSEPALCKCWRCPGHSTCSRKLHMPSATTPIHDGSVPWGTHLPSNATSSTQPPSGAEAPLDLVVRNTKLRARYCDSFPFSLNSSSVQNCSFLSQHTSRRKCGYLLGALVGCGGEGFDKP